MRKDALGITLPGIGAVLSLSLSLVLFVRPDVVEAKSHPFLAAHVGSWLAQNNTWFIGHPSRIAEAHRVVADFCYYCPNQHRQAVTGDAQFPVDVMIRVYHGTLDNLFLGILLPLIVNLLVILGATLAARSQPTSWPCMIAVNAAATFSTGLALAAYFLTPSAFHFVVLRDQLMFPVGCGVLLGMSGLICAIRRSPASHSQPR
jgi:hypothetical protein